MAKQVVIVTTPIHHPKEPMAALIPGEGTKEGVLAFLNNNEAWYNYAVEQGWVIEKKQKNGKTSRLI